jgi:hypothetical protein
MTIQRQYSLPNCTLVLEGLGDLALMGQADVRPLMSVLINAECHLPGQEKPLSGGREFLESLVKTVSQYAQELLSGVHATSHLKHSNALVQLAPLDKTHHRLSVLPEGALPGSGIAAHLTRNIDLTTVQLFDLIEAVDQFFADTQTLPDLALNVKPLSRRLARGNESASQQVVPAALGLSGLVLAAIALFAIPIPKINQPTCLKQGDPTCEKTTPAQPGASPTVSPTPTSGSPTASPSASAPADRPTTAASPSGLTAVPANAPEITDAAELTTLGKTLYSKINDTWKTRTPIQNDLVYQVGVNPNGEIVGAKPINDAAVSNIKQTPLLDLLPTPPGGSQATTQPLGLFKVVFTSTGILDVAPWRQAMASPISSTPQEITDARTIKALQPKLYDQIDQNWKADPGFDKELIFRVRVKQDGSIFDYRPESQSATDFVKETPLPQLGKPVAENSPPSQESLALYKVVFKPNGVLEISPWRGRKD